MWSTQKHPKLTRWKNIFFRMHNFNWQSKLHSHSISIFFSASLLEWKVFSYHLIERSSFPYNAKENRLPYILVDLNISFVSIDTCNGTHIHTHTHTIYHVAHDLIHRLYGYSLHFYSKKIIIIFCVTIQNMTVCWLWAHIDQSCSP